MSKRIVVEDNEIAAIVAAYREKDENGKPVYTWQQMCDKFNKSLSSLSAILKDEPRRGKQQQAKSQPRKKKRRVIAGIEAEVNSALTAAAQSPDQRLTRAVRTFIATINDPDILFVEIDFRTRQCKVARLTNIEPWSI